MRKLILLPAIAALTLTACASGGTPIAAQKLTAPEHLKMACPDLPQPPTGKTQDLLANHVAVAKTYHQCRERHRGLADWLEKTKND